MLALTDDDFRAVFRECLAELHNEREPTFKNGFMKYAVLLALAALDTNDAAVQQSIDILVALRQQFLAQDPDDESPLYHDARTSNTP